MVSYYRKGNKSANKLGLQDSGFPIICCLTFIKLCYFPDLTFFACNTSTGSCVHACVYVCVFMGVSEGWLILDADQLLSTKQTQNLRLRKSQNVLKQYHNLYQ